MTADLLLTWLSSAGSWAWHTAVTLFLFLNVAAVAIVVVTRNRALVDRWTPSWLTANLALVGFGVGVPMLTSAVWLVVSALPDMVTAAAGLPK